MKTIHVSDRLAKIILIGNFVLLFILITSPLWPHGTVTSPPSRIWGCYQEGPENPQSPACISAVATHGTQPLYDWNEINQANANGDHKAVVPNGNLASGGRPDKYGGMDQVRDDWIATPVVPGPMAIIWSNSAPHATSYYDVYITNEDWNPSKPLTWDNLTLLTSTPASQAASTVEIPVILPDRVGKHVIYSVWQRSDSPEAFYSASDVDFGEPTTSIEAENLERLGFTLAQNYPNPFNPETTIDFELARGMDIQLDVFAVTGEHLVTLAAGFKNAGVHQESWDGRNLAGQPVPSGAYLYRLRAGNRVMVRKMLLVK